MLGLGGGVRGGALLLFFLLIVCFCAFTSYEFMQIRHLVRKNSYKFLLDHSAGCYVFFPPICLLRLLPFFKDFLYFKRWHGAGEFRRIDLP